MKKNIFKCKSVLLALLTCILFACVSACGSSGGSDSTSRYAGAWSGYVSLVSNSCARQIPEQFLTIDILHNVEQSVSEDSLGNKTLDIVLNDGSDTYVGVGELDEVSGDSFTATGSAHELPGFLNNYTCIEVIDFQYNGITYDNSEDAFYSANAGYVERHSTITCTKGVEVKTCDVTYTGSATKY